MVAALVLLAAVASAEPAPAHADPPPTAPAAPAAPAGSGEDGLIDRSHAFVSQHLVDSVAWFDQLFADERNADFQRNGSSVRVQLELKPDTTGAVTPRFGLHLDLALPGLEGWFDSLRLVVYARSLTNEAVAPPEDPAAPLAAPDASGGRATAELRYEVLNLLFSHVDVGAGLRGDVPPAAFLRTRWRSTVPIGLGSLGRFTLAGFYDSALRFGTLGEATFERPFGRRFLLRLANVASVSEARSFLGFEWRSEASFTWAPGATRAWRIGAGATGVTRPFFEENLSRVFASHRRDVWRRWLFFEIEPDVEWQRDIVTGARRTVYGIAFRTEIYFDGTYALAPAR
ncbi:MAG TPA: hypothetical protein VFP65_03415 [Anaeromyxobacteraceae bacterium]|nr:hypothetical protein [Anaeromyxobacteraceae bacterium]